MPLFAVKAWVVVTIIVIIALVAGLVALSIYGKKLQNRQEESQKQLQAAAQNASFLVIDKKKMKLKDSGLPQLVIDQTPKRFRGQKVPIVKAKIGASMSCSKCTCIVIVHSFPFSSALVSLPISSVILYPVIMASLVPYSRRSGFTSLFAVPAAAAAAAVIS